MSLADAIRRAAGPIVAKLSGELGSKVLYAKALTARRADNSTVPYWESYAKDQSLVIEQLSASSAQFVWGVDPTTAMEAFGPLNTSVRPGDAVFVTSGYLAGVVYTISDTRPDDLSQSMKLLLVSPESPILYYDMPPMAQDALVLAFDPNTDGATATGFPRIGPAYTLGGTTGTVPKRYGPKNARVDFNNDAEYIDFGDTLESVIRGAQGFSVICGVQHYAGDGGWWLSRYGPIAPGLAQFQIYSSSGLTTFWVQEGPTTNDAVVHQTGVIMNVGRNYMGMTYDRPNTDLTKRVRGFKNGVSMGGASVRNGGGLITTVIPAVVGGSLRVGLPLGQAGTVIPSATPLYMYNRALTDQEHAVNAAWIAARQDPTYVDIIPRGPYPMIPTAGLVNDWDPANYVEGGPLIDSVGGANAALQLDAGGVVPKKRANGNWVDYTGKTAGFKIDALPVIDSFSEIGVVLISAMTVSAFSTLWGFTLISLPSGANAASRFLALVSVGLNDLYFGVSAKGYGVNLPEINWADFQLSEGATLVLARTVTPTELRVFINGRLTGEMKLDRAHSTGTPATAAYAFGRNYDAPATTTALNGALGRIIRYNRALTDAEMIEAHIKLRERYTELPAAGDPTSLRTSVPVTNGLVNDWDPTDQTIAGIKDVNMGVDAMFGSVPPTWEVSPPMIKFPVGAGNANTYAETAPNALTRYDEYTDMVVARFDVTLLNNTLAIIAQGNQDATATWVGDRIETTGGDAASTNIRATMIPGPSVTEILDETPALPRWCTLAMQVKANAVSLFIDGVLVASNMPRGYIRDGVAATVAASFGRVAVGGGQPLRDTALGRRLRYSRALTADEMKQTHNALRIKYPALPRVW